MTKIMFACLPRKSHAALLVRLFLLILAGGLQNSDQAWATEGSSVQPVYLPGPYNPNPNLLPASLANFQRYAGAERNDNGWRAFGHGWRFGAIPADGPYAVTGGVEALPVLGSRLTVRLSHRIVAAIVAASRKRATSGGAELILTLRHPTSAPHIAPGVPPQHALLVSFLSDNSETSAAFAQPLTLRLPVDAREFEPTVESDSNAPLKGALLVSLYSADKPNAAALFAQRLTLRSDTRLSIPLPDMTAAIPAGDMVLSLERVGADTAGDVVLAQVQISQNYSLPLRPPHPQPFAGQMLQSGNPPFYFSQGKMHVKLYVNQLKGAWGWSDVGEANKDANGYPIRLAGKPYSASVILYTDPAMAGIAPYSGTFRLYGRGTGQFNIGWGKILREQSTDSLPREIIQGKEYWYVDFEYDPRSSPGNVAMVIKSLPDPDDHIRDLALVHASQIADWKRGEKFMPQAIADLSLFGRQQAKRRAKAARSGSSLHGALRYVQQLQVVSIWNPGGDYTRMTDAQRDRRFVGPNYYSFPRIQNNGGPETEKLIPIAMPIEDIVDLANLTDTDIWYLLAADILDSRARQIGTYVRDHLKPGLKVYWEYGNEVWNSARGFDDYQYAQAMGQNAFPDLRGTRAVYQWDVYRSMQLFSVMRGIFAGSPDRSRYMATFFAMDASNGPDGKIHPDSFAAQYFAATEARKKPDIGALPENIVTDMAVGGYFGSPPKNVADYLMAYYPTDTARAWAFTRMVEMGDDGKMVEVGPQNIGHPMTGVAPETPIGVYALLAQDGQTGLDLFTDLSKVLRLQGTELEYRGVRSTDWQTVVMFSRPPNTTIERMVYEVQLMGFGQRWPITYTGFQSQLRNVLRDRVEAHIAFAKAHHLTFNFYEGGPGADGAPGSDPQSTVSFMNAYHYDGWAAEVMGKFMHMIDGDVAQMTWYSTHNFYYNGYWGLKRYFGQPDADSPKWKVVEDSILLQSP